MKQHFNRILLIQGIVLTAMGVFANDAHFPTYSFRDNTTSITGKPGLDIIIPLYTEDTNADAKNAMAKTVLTESLVSFNATYMSHAIDLRWNVTNGNRYDHFYIERSVDGMIFEKVGEVNGDAAYSAAHDYSFTDYVKPAVARKNDLYYRLKQIDAGQKSSYSKILIVRMYNTKSVTAVSVTPDPTVNDILVNVQLKENSFVAITVKDDKGSQVMKKTARAANGANSFSLDGTSRLKQGNYQLEVIINSNERMTMQLIKS